MKKPLLGMALALLSVVAAAASPTPTVTFRGTTYNLSRTNGNEYDFTPAEQKEPSTDVLTLLLLSRIKDGEALADLANRTLNKLRKARPPSCARILFPLRRRSRPSISWPS